MYSPVLFLIIYTYFEYSPLGVRFKSKFTDERKCSESLNVSELLLLIYENGAMYVSYTLCHGDLVVTSHRVAIPCLKQTEEEHE